MYSMSVSCSGLKAQLPHNGMTQKYGVYFPADEQTVDVSLDSEDDLQFLD